MAEQTAFNSTCDASWNFRLFAKSSIKNLIALGICEKASINASLQGSASFPAGKMVVESLGDVVAFDFLGHPTRSWVEGWKI
ncbi:hypothetical protein GOBAR_AA24155 [Gossypium barbadense]|uniref:Uncharacterized protein n=1 Tax=Gossypium barbadense TaxID=3634 RepID=A0A2P5WZK3_GOSBA|nr:hypothetical protein GOBAR_AA24155 [Gossypium barbadense]